MTDLSDFQEQIDELYVGKGWSKDFYYLMARAHQELSEFMQSVMKWEAGEPEPKTIRGGKIDCHHRWVFAAQISSDSDFADYPRGKLICQDCGAKGRPYVEEDLAEEWSDAMHFIFEIPKVKIPNADLEVALQKKINSNWHNQKKTIDASGKAVLK